MSFIIEILLSTDVCRLFLNDFLLVLVVLNIELLGDTEDFLLSTESWFAFCWDLGGDSDELHERFFLLFFRESLFDTSDEFSDKSLSEDSEMTVFRMPFKLFLFILPCLFFDGCEPSLENSFTVSKDVSFCLSDVPLGNLSSLLACVFCFSLACFINPSDLSLEFSLIVEFV